MLSGLRQFLMEVKAKRMLKRATRIITKLGYEVADSDVGNFTLAFKLKEESLALFIADASTLGSRLEATIVMPSSLVNLKMMSDIATAGCSNRCSITGAVNCGRQLTKVDLIYCLGEQFNKTSIDNGITYMCQALNGISELLVRRLGMSKSFKFDLTMFDQEGMPFFDPGLIGERKLYMYGDDWGNYISESANQNAVGGFTAVDIDHDLDVICACREFEQMNDCALADVGGLVMMELAKHRNNKISPPSKEEIQ